MNTPNSRPESEGVPKKPSKLGVTCDPHSTIYKVLERKGLLGVLDVLPGTRVEPATDDMSDVQEPKGEVTLVPVKHAEEGTIVEANPPYEQQLCNQIAAIIRRMRHHELLGEIIVSQLLVSFDGLFSLYCRAVKSPPGFLVDKLQSVGIVPDSFDQPMSVPEGQTLKASIERQLAYLRETVLRAIQKNNWKSFDSGDHVGNAVMILEMRNSLENLTDNT